MVRYTPVASSLGMAISLSGIDARCGENLVLAGIVRVAGGD